MFKMAAAGCSPHMTSSGVRHRDYFNNSREVERATRCLGVNSSPGCSLIHDSPDKKSRFRRETKNIIPDCLIYKISKFLFKRGKRYETACY